MGMIEQKIVMRMNLLKLSRLVLSQLTGIREQSLSPGLKSMKPFANTDLELIHRTLAEIESLALRVKPFLLPIDDIRKLRFLLEKQRDGDLDHLPAQQTLWLIEEMQKQGLDVAEDAAIVQSLRST